MARRWDQTTHGANLNRVLKKIYNAIMKTDSNEELASLANSYGYLLNVHNNIRKSFVFDHRITELEHLAGLTKKLMPDDSKFVLRN